MDEGEVDDENEDDDGKRGKVRGQVLGAFGSALGWSSRLPPWTRSLCCHAQDTPRLQDLKL